jgi:hypothetical protein
MKLSTIYRIENRMKRAIARGCLRIWHVTEGVRKKQRAADTRPLKRLRRKYESALVRSGLHPQAAFERAHLFGIPQAA